MERRKKKPPKAKSQLEKRPKKGQIRYNLSTEKDTTCTSTSSFTASFRNDSIDDEDDTTCMLFTYIITIG